MPKVVVLLALLACCRMSVSATSFTYQGRLQDSNSPVTGFFDFRFGLYGAVSDDSPIAGIVNSNGVWVSNGLFTVALDFWAAFDGSPRWLEIAVKTNGAASFTTLAPRQPLTAVPHASHAEHVNAAGITGQIPATMLAPGAAAANLAQGGQSPVVSGTAVLSLRDDDTNLIAAGFVPNGGYIPALNFWREKSSQGAPSPRTGHAALWTGDRMIVWGGNHGNDNPSYPPPKTLFTDGAIYDPVTDVWAPMASAGAPRGREWFTAVWTGTEMLVWGGYFYDGSYNYLADGARYNLASNTWVAMSTNGAPTRRYRHSAIWTGTEMIIWGGMASASSGLENAPYNDGARYNPVSDTWTPISANGAPTPRIKHVAVWTGTEMIVWGGQGGSGLDIYWADGGRYNPTTDSWTPVSTTNNPGSGRSGVWTGRELLVWDCGPVSVDSPAWGGRYSPQTDTWSGIQQQFAPVARLRSSVCWTGNEMVIWGGEISEARNDGACYDPEWNTWTALTTTPLAPPSRSGHTAVWTGSAILVFGGRNGAGWLGDTWSCTLPKPMFLYLRQ